MKKHAILAAGLLLASFLADANAIYYCSKNGKKIISDLPCQNQDAEEHKRVYGQNVAPIETSQGLRSAQTDQGRQMDPRAQQQAQPDEQLRQVKLQQRNEQVEKKRVCAGLEARKQNYTAAQRAPNSTQMLDWYREQLRGVNDELYSRNCETL